MRRKCDSVFKLESRPPGTGEADFALEGEYPTLREAELEAMRMLSVDPDQEMRVVQVVGVVWRNYFIDQRKGRK